MFRLGAITDEFSMDFEHALDVMLEYGLKEVELRGLWNKNIADLTDEDVKRAKEAIVKRGMRVCVLSTPFFKCDEPGLKKAGVTGPTHLATERTFEQQIELLNRLIEIAKIFGTKIIRTFSFWKRSPLTDEVWKKIVNAYKEPLEIAKKEGVVLALENEAACYIGTGKEAGKLVREINDSNLKIVWDPGNAFCAGEVPYPDGYEDVKGYIIHVHLKDPTINKETGKPEFTIMGQGKVDYRGQFKALAKDFDGVLSLETHYRINDGTPEQSSRQCMEGIKKIMVELGLG